MQGLTLDKIVVDMKGGRFSPGQAYVAFSRVKFLTDLHTLNFTRKAIIDVDNEKFRLNSNLLQFVPQVPYNPFHVTTALLNVSSILAKLPDITTDPNLISASILCFCETWLSPSQPTPLLLDDQIDIRCGPFTCENKSGVLICVLSQLNPANVHRFATTVQLHFRIIMCNLS